MLKTKNIGLWLAPVSIANRPLMRSVVKMKSTSILAVQSLKYRWELKA